MPIRNLDKIFAARSIAIIGVSNRVNSVGHTVVKNLVASGFSGKLYPITPRHDAIEGVTCVASLNDLPEVVDLAVISTPAAAVPETVRRCGQAGIRGIVILSAGFREVGLRGQALEDEIRQVQQQFEGMRIIGPNCLGVLSPHQGMNASFASHSAMSGHVAFISQSGALCTAVLDWAKEAKVGFSHFVSVGNMLDVGIADLIDYFSMDRWTDSIILYVESITNARQFMSAARAFTRSKPIIAYKAGRFAESAKAAASHTGAMIGVDSVYEAALSRAGIVRVYEMDDLFDCAGLLARHRTPKGDRLAIVTNAGGPGVMATDALLHRNGTLAKLSESTIQQLSQTLPRPWSHGNPVDILGDADANRFGETLKTVIADGGVDGVLVILSPQAMTDPDGSAEQVIAATKGSRKPVLAAWMGGESVRSGIQRFHDAGIATYPTPEKAVSAFMHLVQYARSREMLYETPRAIPVTFHLDRDRLQQVFSEVASDTSDSGDTLSEAASKTLLEAYGIPVTTTHAASTQDEAIQLAERVGFPVVMKIRSPQITHKSDVDGVELNLTCRDDVRAAFTRITSAAAQQRPEAQIQGVTLQRMFAEPYGRELIVGAKRDPVFGSVVMVGVGGTMAELLDDRALELPPLNEALARRMLESLRVWPMLQHYRGKPAVNLDRLVEVLMRISYLVADHPEILELDVNPLVVTPKNAVALDARVVLDRPMLGQSRSPYSHLAIRPYPSQFIKQVTLADGSSALLRPIKPEDEPMWCKLLASCSPETIQMRFRYMFKATTHELASRFCFNDYDRELAIVAEMELNGQQELVGVARLVADVDHREAEYAVLVGDAWQRKGLGAILTDYCLQICDSWNIHRVVAEMSPENRRMIEIFTRRGFELNRTVASDVVVARKEWHRDKQQN